MINKHNNIHYMIAQDINIYNKLNYIINTTFKISDLDLYFIDKLTIINNIILLFDKYKLTNNFLI